MIGLLTAALHRALDFPKLVRRNAVPSKFLVNPIRPVALGRSNLIHPANLQCAGMLYLKGRQTPSEPGHLVRQERTDFSAHFFLCPFFMRRVLNTLSPLTSSQLFDLSTDLSTAVESFLNPRQTFKRSTEYFSYNPFLRDGAGLNPTVRLALMWMVAPV